VRTVRGLLATTMIGVAASALTGPASYAAPTDLDPGFGAGGKVAVDIGVSAYTRDLAALPDGSYVNVGSTDESSSDGYAVKIGPNGVVDPSFGVRRLDNAGSVDYAAAVAVQPDGKIVVVGFTSKNSDGAVWRLLPSGAPDLSFDGDGFANVDSAAIEQLYDVAITGDGKIVVAGSTSAGGGQAAVYRLTSTGQPDNTFAGDGAIGLGVGSDVAYAVAVQPDGKVVVTGPSNTTSATVYRLTESGDPDSSFDGDGVAAIPGTLPLGDALTLQPDGRILLSTQTFTAPGDYDATVVRLTSNGSVDGSFTSVPIDLGGDENVWSLGLTSTGQIVGAGGTNVGENAFLVRLDPNGALDRAFGDQGLHVVPGTPSWLTGVVVQADGKILATGDDDKARNKPVVVRYVGSPVVTGAQPTCQGKAATLVGTAGKDRLKGTTKADVIVALGGNDVVKGLGGDDLVCAGDGNDTVIGGAGKDRLYGERGKDRLVGGSGKDRLVGGPDRDSTSQ